MHFNGNIVTQLVCLPSAWEVIQEARLLWFIEEEMQAMNVCFRCLVETLFQDEIERVGVNVSFSDF